MPQLIDNPTFATELQPLLTALIANATDGPTQQTFISSLTTLLNTWTANSAIGAQIAAQTALVQQLLNQFLAIAIKGTVTTAADLPTTAGAGMVNGAAYIALDTLVAYACINGSWVDIGAVSIQVDGADYASSGAAALASTTAAERLALFDAMQSDGLFSRFSGAEAG